MPGTQRSQRRWRSVAAGSSCVWAVVWSLAVSGHAQQAPTFRTATRLIVTTVVVKDRGGTAVEGLTAKDFIVTEDNEPQDVAFVEFQRLDDAAPLPPLSTVQDVAPPAAD